MAEPLCPTCDLLEKRYHQNISETLTFFRGCHFIIFVNQNGTALRYYMRKECRFKEIQSASHAASRLPSILQQIFSKELCMMVCESQLCGNFGVDSTVNRNRTTVKSTTEARRINQRHIVSTDTVCVKGSCA